MVSRILPIVIEVDIDLVWDLSISLGVKRLEVEFSGLIIDDFVDNLFHEDLVADFAFDGSLSLQNLLYLTLDFALILLPIHLTLFRKIEYFNSIAIGSEIPQLVHFLEDLAALVIWPGAVLHLLGVGADLKWFVGETSHDVAILFLFDLEDGATIDPNYIDIWDVALGVNLVLDHALNVHAWEDVGWYGLALGAAFIIFYHP